MSIRSAIAIMFAAGAALSLAGCGPAEEPFAEPAVADATSPEDTATADAIDATHVIDRAPVADAAPGFDARAFAGTFVAEGAQLQLAADGIYTFTVHAESADADLVTTGTWTVEADGTAILLDPDSKDDPDRRFTIASSDELVAVEGGRVLNRDGA